MIKRFFIKLLSKSTFLKNYVDRKKYNLPNLIEKVWYNGRIHGLESKNGIFYPYVFRDDLITYRSQYINAENGLICFVGTTSDGKSIFYKIVNMRYKPGGDWLYATDCLDVDLKFSHLEDAIKKAPNPTLEKMIKGITDKF